MIDLVLTHLNQPWGPPWILETLGDPWRPLATIGDMPENGHLLYMTHEWPKFCVKNLWTHFHKKKMEKLRWKVRKRWEWWAGLNTQLSFGSCPMGFIPSTIVVIVIIIIIARNSRMHVEWSSMQKHFHFTLFKGFALHGGFVLGQLWNKANPLVKIIFNPEIQTNRSTHKTT